MLNPLNVHLILEKVYIERQILYFKVEMWMVNARRVKLAGSIQFGGL